jgi:protoporphyrinogen oxidase
VTSGTTIVGAGLLGLGLALRLAERGEPVTVLEAAPTLGGLATSCELGGYRCDRFYHVVLPTDARTLALLAELGLGGAVRWNEVRTALYAPDGIVHDTTDAARFLRSAPLRPADKARLALTVADALRRRDGTTLEAVGVEEWLRRRSGDRAFEVFWLPLLRAKLGDAYRDTSAAFIWATVRRLLADRRRGLTGQRFGSLAGGWGPAVDALAARVRAAGGTIETGRRVRHVRRTGGGGLAVTTEDGSVRPTARAVLTAAGPLAAALCPDLTGPERQRLAAVRYQGVVCVAALLDRPLGGYYLTNITAPGSALTGVVEMTALTGTASVGGRTLVYLPRYVAPDDPRFDLADDDVATEALAELWRIYPHARCEPTAWEVSRVRNVFAVPIRNYSTTMPPVATSVPGLYTVGSAQLPFSPLNVNDTLGLVDVALAAMSGPIARPEAA